MRKTSKVKLDLKNDIYFNVIYFPLILKDKKI